MAADHTIAASFAINAYTLTVNQPASGSIAPPSGTYNHGDEVTLTATAPEGYEFDAWTDDCAGQGNPCTLQMTADKTVGVTFKIKNYTLTIDIVGSGTVAKSPDSASYAHGTTVTLTPAGATGYTFTGWSGANVGDLIDNGNGTWSIVMNGAKSLTATFSNQYTLLVSVSGSGSVTRVPDQPTYTYGSQVTLTAVPALGWSLDHWSGACSGNGACVVTMDANKTVSATFTQDAYTLIIVQATGGTITADRTGPFTYGEQVTLTAVPDGGYDFTAWNGDVSGAANPLTITMVRNMTVSATFTLIPPPCYALTLIHTGNGSDPVASPTNSVGCSTGWYLEGADITLSGAAPEVGWKIISWTGTDANTSTAATNALTMPASAHSAAVNYGQIEYALTISSAHGPVSVNTQPPYYYNDQVTLTMGVVDAGWTFTGWDVAGCTGTGTCTVTITSDTIVTANFTQNEYTLNVTAGAGGSASKLPDQATYHLGDLVTLTATASPGYTFNGWTGDHTGSVSPVQITVTGNMNTVANFTQNEYTLNVTAGAGGSVSKSPDQATYHLGDLVTLTATPNAGYTFSGWTGDHTGTISPVEIAVTGDMNILANFTQDQYSLTINVSPAECAECTATPSVAAPYVYNQVVTLAAAAQAGWQFDHWKVGETDVLGSPTDITITGNMVVTAYFTQIPYTLGLSASPVEGGTVSASPAGPVYHYGDEVTLTPNPAAGYAFTSWSGPNAGELTDNGDGTWSIVMNGNKSFTAVFALEEYVLDIQIVGNGSVVADPLGPYHYNDLVTLTPSADLGWSFASWEGACSGNGDCQVVMQGDTTVIAVFTEDEYVLDITTIGNGSVAANPTGPYLYGTEVILTATPDPGWVVSEWSVEGCTGNTCTVTMYGDQSVIVTFTQHIEYSLTTSVVGNGSITRNPDSPTYPRDTMVLLTAVPDAGWFFDHWEGNCSGANPCTVTMDGDKSVTAFFTEGQLLRQNLVETPGTLREGFESMSGWTVNGSGSGYSAALDTTNFKEGSASIKLTTPANGSVYITKTVNWNLSADQGNFRLWVYVSGATEPTGGSIILSSDANLTSYFSTSYGGAFKLRYKPGWNLINLRTSDWKTTGTPNWANIVRIRIRLDSKSVNTYSFDALTSGVMARPAVIFTFDKGLSSLYSQAFAYMQTHNVRGTGYVVTDWAGTAGYASWAQLKEMYDAGWTIGNQTKDNIDLTTLSRTDQEARLSAARAALMANGILIPDYVAYPGGKYNTDTLLAMASLSMRTGRTLLTFNNVSPLGSPFEIAQRTISKSTTLSTAESWVDTAKARQEILVITLQGLSASPASTDWYIARFQSLVDYCIAQGIPIITMDDLYRLQTGDITIPGPR